MIQRVSRGVVRVDSEVVGEIERGYVLLVGITHFDTLAESSFLAQKVLDLRLFADEDGKTNRSILDVLGSLLVISQFTLYADTRKGRRPSFTDAASPDHAIPLYEHFVSQLRSSGLRVETGRFGADMQVEIHNDGPLTLMLEREFSGA